MIQVNRIRPQEVEFYDPKGNFLGMVNEYEFNDVRLQICKENVEGYYCMFEGKRMDIDSNGKCNRGSVDFFDLQLKQLGNLFSAQAKKIKS